MVISKKLGRGLAVVGIGVVLGIGSLGAPAHADEYLPRPGSGGPSGLDPRPPSPPPSGRCLGPGGEYHSAGEQVYVTNQYGDISLLTCLGNGTWDTKDVFLPEESNK